MNDLQTDHVLGDIEDQINDEVAEHNQDSIKALKVLRNNLEELAMVDAYNGDILSDEIYDIQEAIGKAELKLYGEE
jgi:hypothetical protein